MNNVDALVDFLNGIDGQGYKAYKGLRGTWAFSYFTLLVDHVQGDPFAAPSRVRVILPKETAALEVDVLGSRSRRLGVASMLAKRFSQAAHGTMVRRGSGKSGVIGIAAPGQEVLAQTAVIVGDDGTVEARFRIGLPAHGRRAGGREAIELITADVPAVVNRSLRAESVGHEDILRHALTNEDADALRAELDTNGWVAFVADAAYLARKSGVDDEPLLGDIAVPFATPAGLTAEVELPNAGTVRGMAIPRGVTLIVGGGYHGKSTLLRAIERGLYNHCYGDGRESVVTDPAAVKIRAEDGRSVAGVDISSFIGTLPQGQDARAFSTPNASGSTSQAAGIVEALEAGATTLLIDEDTAATNFMIRDRRMQALVPKEGEPITPLVDRVRSLWETRGISCVIVLGGSGDYLDVADTVVAMKNFRPFDVTTDARRVAAELPTGREREGSARTDRGVPDTTSRPHLGRSQYREAGSGDQGLQGAFVVVRERDDRRFRHHPTRVLRPDARRGPRVIDGPDTVHGRAAFRERDSEPRHTSDRGERPGHAGRSEGRRSRSIPSDGTRRRSESSTYPRGVYGASQRRLLRRHTVLNERFPPERRGVPIRGGGNHVP